MNSHHPETKSPVETPRHERREEGVAMIYVAVFLLSSLWFASLAIDMGKLMTTRTELQRAADAAALAGASSIDPTNGNIVQDSARVRAAYTSSQNTALEDKSRAVTIDPASDVTFPNVHKVRVQVHREAATGNPMTTTFARTVGVPTLDVTAHAVAEVSPLSKVCDRLVPFAPVVQGTPFSTACGTSYTLKAASGTSGNFQLLDFPDCNEGPCADASAGGGAAEVKCLMIHGYGCCIGIGDNFTDTQPGNKLGPLRDALQQRWDADTDHSAACFQSYSGNGQRVLPVPIVKTFDVNGKKNATITGFGAFFLLARPTGGGQNMQITGQFIDYLAPGEFGPPPPSGPVLYGVHLVQD